MLPPRSHAGWRDLLNGRHGELKCLGLKIMLSRLRLDYQRDPHSIGNAITELENFIQKNSHVVADDVRRIFG